MDIIFQTNDENKKLELRGISQYDTVYKCTLVVNSNGFGAEKPFFFDKFYLNKFLKCLQRMDKDLSGETVLKQEYEYNFIKISCDSKGHVIIQGEIAEYGGPNQKLEFEFVTDQTILLPLIRDVENLIKDTTK